MTAFLLSVHVLAAIVFIGPVTVAASLFPRYARAGAVGVVDALHRISRVYSVLGLAVPVFGIATAIQLGVLGDAWLIVSLGLTVLAGALLALVVLPEQARVVAALHATEHQPAGTQPAGALPAGRLPAGEPPLVPPRLAMTTGMFALIWAVVVVLMIVRPGSTTGVSG